MPIQYYIFLSLILFTIGIVGILIRRNMIVVFMCIEMMLNSVNFLLVAFSKYHASISGAVTTTAQGGGADAQVFVFFTMLVAAAEVAIGLAIMIMIYRNTHSINVNHLSRLKH